MTISRHLGVWRQVLLDPAKGGRPRVLLPEQMGDRERVHPGRADDGESHAERHGGAEAWAAAAHPRQSRRRQEIHEHRGDQQVAVVEVTGPRDDVGGEHDNRWSQQERERRGVRAEHRDHPRQRQGDDRQTQPVQREPLQRLGDDHRPLDPGRHDGPPEVHPVTELVHEGPGVAQELRRGEAERGQGERAGQPGAAERAARRRPGAGDGSHDHGDGRRRPHRIWRPPPARRGGRPGESALSGRSSVPGRRRPGWP